MRKLFLHLMQMILMFRRNRLIAPLVRDCKIVGDFGCGAYPSKFAMITIDNLELGDEQRGFHHLDTSRSFVAWDLNCYPWPFQNKHFDYAICTHVLEHLLDPVKACQELSRVAKAGYVEMPYWCVDAYIRNTDIIHTSLCSWNSDLEMFFFWNKVEYLKKHPPCEMPLFMRFLMSLRPIRVAWSGKIKAAPASWL
jgi:SAM-dependent methyltransferase